MDGTPGRAAAIRARVGMDEDQAVVQIEAPDGAVIPSGWAARLGTASRLIEREGGQLVADEESPSCRLRLPPGMLGSPSDP